MPSYRICNDSEAADSVLASSSQWRWGCPISSPDSGSNKAEQLFPVQSTRIQHIHMYRAGCMDEQSQTRSHELRQHHWPHLLSHLCPGAVVFHSLTHPRSWLQFPWDAVVTQPRVLSLKNPFCVYLLVPCASPHCPDVHQHPHTHKPTLAPGGAMHPGMVPSGAGTGCHSLRSPQSLASRYNYFRSNYFEKKSH